MQAKGAKETKGNTASATIDARIEELADWRGRTLSRLRAIVKRADPDVVEEWKWVKPTSPGVPVWSHDGLICTGEVYKDKVKVTFAKGASLEDPKGLFNSSLEGNARRAIDFYEGDEIDEKALTALIRSAAALNASRATKSSAAKSKPKRDGALGDARAKAKAPAPQSKPKHGKPEDTRAKAKAPAPQSKPKLLSGGNPQIPKADGDAPVQTYIANMPGWKRDVGRYLDALIVENVPKVRKAVKWNSPFYGIENRGWFLSFHCFTRYVKVTFFRGTSLRPLPPGESKDPEVRYLDLYENEAPDEKRLASWIRQAAKLPGWVP